MADIKISYQQVAQTASDIRTEKANMQATLAEVKAEMDKVGGADIWVSAGASQARATFDQLSAKFEPFCEDVETYAKFLDETVQIYTEADEALKKAAAGSGPTASVQ